LANSHYLITQHLLSTVALQRRLAALSTSHHP